MKVKVRANELVQTDIDMVSLVKHGANRCPFKILKSEDAPTLRERVEGLVRLGKSEARVVAYFIRKDSFPELEPILKAAGIDTRKPEVIEEAVVIRVAKGLRPLGHVQLSEALAVAIDQPIGEFSEESIVKSYADSLGLSGFAPGIHFAVQALARPVWSFLNGDESEAKEHRIEKVDAMLVSFRKYVNALAKLLPNQVFEIEKAVNDHLVSEDSIVKKPRPLKEAMTGDLGDLLDTPQHLAKDELDEPDPAPVIEKEVEKQVAAPAAESEDTASTPAATDPPAAASPPAPSAAVGEDPETELAKAAQALTLAVGAIKELSAAVIKTTADQSALAERVDRISTLLEQTAQLATEAHESTATAKTTVSKAADVDLALASLGGIQPKSRVQKTEAGVFDNLMQDLEGFVRYR